MSVTSGRAAPIICAHSSWGCDSCGQQARIYTDKVAVTCRGIKSTQIAVVSVFEKLARPDATYQS